MKTQSISHLLYYPITFYARSSPSNSYLSSPPLRYFPFYPFLAAWNHRYADNHKWRAGRKQGGTSRGWQEGTCAGFVRQRGSNGLALRDWKSCPIYDYILRDNNDSSDYKSNVAHRSRESYDDYKRWYERFRERCNYVFVRITNGWQRIPIEIENLTSPLCDFYIYILLDFSNCDPRRSPLSQTRIRLFFFFALHGSSPCSKRVPLWSSLWASLHGVSLNPFYHILVENLFDPPSEEALDV